MQLYKAPSFVPPYQITDLQRQLAAVPIENTNKLEVALVILCRVPKPPNTDPSQLRLCVPRDATARTRSTSPCPCPISRINLKRP